MFKINKPIMKRTNTKIVIVYLLNLKPLKYCLPQPVHFFDTPSSSEPQYLQYFILDLFYNKLTYKKRAAL